MEVPYHRVLARGTDGPFLCSMCEYFRAPTRCLHSYIVQHFGGTVGGDWCCDFFEKNTKLNSLKNISVKRSHDDPTR